MERSSSQRDLRAERLARTPYSRPQQSSSSSLVRKATAQSPFASFRSLVSYVASPFTRSSSLLPTHTNELPVDIDQKSESGSEDGWNGEPPAPMEGQDVFTLASAAGRTGDEFEARAATWRAKGERPGGRRDTARLHLEVVPAPVEVDPSIPAPPGHFKSIKASPSMPSLLTSSSKLPSSTSKRSLAVEAPQPEASSSTLKRTRSPPITNGTLPFRPPLPAFLPPSTSNATSSSASSVALSAFLDAKKGQQMTLEDFRVIETLTENMKTESHVGSPVKEEKLGGWAAGSYASGIRHSQSLANLSTPAKSTGALLTTPGPVFSVGLNLAPGGGGKSSPYRQRYLGPGMSPRRMFPQAKKTGLQPLIQFEDPPEEGESAKKKRRVIEAGDIDIDVQTPQASPSSKGSAATSVSATPTEVPSSPFITSKNKLSIPSHTPARPSPLSQTVSTPGSVKGAGNSERQASIEAAGKKRAAQILKDLIDEELGPLEPTRKNEPIIFNPYDKTSLSPAPAVPPTTPSTSFVGSTPRKSSRAETPVRKTPLRGAAAKLEAHKEMMKGARPLTTVERIKGVQPWQIADGFASPAGKTPEASDGPSTPASAIHSRAESADASEIDDNMDGEDSSPASPAAGPSSSGKSVAARRVTPEPSSAPAFVKIPSAEVFKPFQPPTVNFSSSPIPKATPAPSLTTFESKTTESILAASKANDKPSELPTFTLPTPQREEPAFIEITKTTPAMPSTKQDVSAIYLSAKDSALKVAKPALPFFTFTLPKAAHDDPQTQAAKEAALKANAQTFVFSLTAASDHELSHSSSTAPAPVGDAEWTCSLCMLKNPASATEKCTICEAPKPAISTPKPTSNVFSTNPGGTGGDWTCDLCMLKNSTTATEKCAICEAPKPKPKTASTTLASGFSSSRPAQPKGNADWTCSLCMLNNPGSAKEKCTICEAPRP